MLVLIGELKRKMADLGLGLYAAHSLISGAAEDENSGGTNWLEVVKRYEASRVGTGQVKPRPTTERNAFASNAPSS